MASVSCYLLWSFTFNELLVNAVGLGHQLFVRCECPEIFTGCPKLNVLFTELRLQEDTKGRFPICGWVREKRKALKDKASNLSQETRTSTHCLPINVR